MSSEIPAARRDVAATGRRSSEAGFTIVEMAVATAIVSLVLIGVMGAVLQVAKVSARENERVRGEQVAQNVLADLRAQVAYESPLSIAALVGKSGSGSATEPVVSGTPVPLPVRWSIASDGMGGALADVRITLPDGQTLEEQSRIIGEAPAPGSTVAFVSVSPTPAPSYPPCPTPVPSPTGWQDNPATPTQPPAPPWCPTSSPPPYGSGS